MQAGSKAEQFDWGCKSTSQPEELSMRMALDMLVAACRLMAETGVKELGPDDSLQRLR